MNLRFGRIKPPNTAAGQMPHLSVAFVKNKLQHLSSQAKFASVNLLVLAPNNKSFLCRNWQEAKIWSRFGSTEHKLTIF